MLGLPDGDTDPFFDTLPDQQSAHSTATPEGGDMSPDESSSFEQEGGDSEEDSSVLEGLLQDPPELVAARKKLEALRQQQAAGRRAQAQHGMAQCTSRCEIWLEALCERCRLLGPMAWLAPWFLCLLPHLLAESMLPTAVPTLGADVVQVRLMSRVVVAGQVSRQTPSLPAGPQRMVLHTWRLSRQHSWSWTQQEGPARRLSAPAQPQQHRSGPVPPQAATSWQL